MQPRRSTQVVGSAVPGPVTRRRFLELVAATGATALLAPLAACSDDASDGAGGGAARPGTTAAEGSETGGTAPAGRFPDGVMAGDPRPDGAVIWTRVGGDEPPSEPPSELAWEIAEDDAFAAVVAGGTVAVAADADHTARVAVEGLAADRWYHYRFVGPDGAGPVGRLRTAPADDASPERLTFAWCSCQQLGDSLYVAHRAMAAEPDLDLFVHLGDYVYVHDQETLTVDDYRDVYHRFKANPLLQELQATVPIVAMFDDGEFYNGVDATGDPERLAAALQAWREAFPVAERNPDDGARSPSYERLVRWGDLVDLFVLDVRSQRDPAVEETDSATPEGAVMFEEGRTTLGAVQKQWLLDGLRSSTTAWRILGNPYDMAMVRLEDRDPGPPRAEGAQPNAGNYFPNEAWDDYQVERREILQAIVDDGVTDVVSVSGHTHVWIAGLMQPDPDDPASPVAAFDFTCGSLTADPDLLDVEGSTPDAERAKQQAVADIGLQINPHLRYLNLIDQGYGLATVTPTEMVLEFKLIDPFDEDAEAKVGARFVLPRNATDVAVERFPEAER